MTQQPFDARKFKKTTRSQWDEAAEAWHRWGPTLGRWLGPATELMLDMAGVAEGGRVIDLAAGACEQSLTAARRVGPKGRVLATDLSPKILEFGAAAAKAEGLAQFSTLESDGEQLQIEPGSFDAAISRVGMIYFPDQQKALREVRRALRTGGKFATIVYSTAENNGFFSVPVGIIRRRAELPPPLPGQPGPFSLGAEGTLAAALEQAGFVDVQSQTIDAPLQMADAAECLRFERESFGALHQMLTGLDEASREATWQEIQTALEKFETTAGFAGPCELVVAGGTSPEQLS